MSEHKRVAVLVDGFQTGGHTTSLVYLLERLTRDGCPAQIEVVSLSGEAAPDGLLPEGVNVQGMPTPPGGSRFSLGRLVRHPRCLSPLIRIVRRLPGPLARRLTMFLMQHYDRLRTQRFDALPGRYDVAISWSDTGALYALVDKVDAAQRIAWIHPDYRQANYSRAVDAPYVSQVDRLVAVSQAGKESLAAVFPEVADRTLVIRNRVDAARLRARAAEGLGQDGSAFDAPFVLVTVARLHDQSKALLRAVDLCVDLTADGVPFRWVVVGDGPDRAAIEARARSRGVEAEMILLGGRSNPYPHMAAADLFVLQSYYEGMPVAVEEALELGVPAFVSDYASAREQVRDGVDGWVVDNTAADLAAALVRLASTPRLVVEAKERLGQGRPAADDDYDQLKGILW